MFRGTPPRPRRNPDIAGQQTVIAASNGDGNAEGNIVGLNEFATEGSPSGKFVMHQDALFDELRRIESEVVEAERLLAAQESLLVDLKRQNRDVSAARAALDAMRKAQQIRQQDRQRLLSMLQP